ncbi:TetR/AcrR family transcriptional regulator [Frigidibacter oleivorans]|uniref:TetR/AcrR family transcriptional regulator n=1 Tax=Frigidibacter oleivorans TaxID=2487129 RepID=UPI000F8C9B2E|nr:TetR/AcrR family transcriptional regulator [Frigidibacter oleivorans]
MARKTGSHADITGPRVRAAALQLFARHGYAAVSMRQIAAEVGVQAGALYLYTPDKQALLFDLMRAHMREVLDRWRDEPKGLSPGERLDAFTRYHIRFSLDRPEAVFVSNMELRNLTPEHFAQIEAMRRSYEDELEAILVAGRADGTFRLEDSKLAALAIIAMLTGVTGWFRSGGRLSRDRVEQVYRGMVRGAAGSA